MMKMLDRKSLISDKNLRRIEFLCLYLTCAMIFVLLLIGVKSNFLTTFPRLGIIGSCALFFIVSFVDIIKNRRSYPYMLALILVAWFVLTQIIQLITGNFIHQYTQFLPVYLLALPFAAITYDQHDRKGLNALCAVYMIISIIWVIYVILLVKNCVPNLLQPLVEWDGTRLTIYGHSNVCARVFLIGIATSIGLSFKTSRIWIKCLLYIAAALMFICMALTNCRTAILPAGLLIGGIVFFQIYKGGWIRFAIGVVLALAITVSLFFVSQAIYQSNSQRLNNQSSLALHTALLEQSASIPSSNSTVALPSHESFVEETNTIGANSEIIYNASSSVHNSGTSPQGSLLSDALTLNSRTYIWRSLFQTIIDNPRILIFGVPTQEIPLLGIVAEHAHNSWLQILAKMGLLGFIISLIFTWKALISSILLLFSKKIDMWKKIIAMLVLCLLFSAIFEPCLFYTSLYWSHIDFFFFLCLGYLLQWKKELRGQASAT